MIKSLKNAQIADGLPRILGEQPWVKALSMAMLELHQKTMGYIAGSQIYTAIDTVAEEVLDALAVNWKIDWYDTGYDIEQKRRIVKTALNIRRTMGTAGAARTQADAIYPGTKLEEWFEYGGTHGKFRLRVNITTVEERQKFAALTSRRSNVGSPLPSGSAHIWRKWNITMRAAPQRPTASRLWLARPGG